MGEKRPNFWPRAGVVSTALCSSHAVNLVGELNELVGDTTGEVMEPPGSIRGASNVLHTLLWARAGEILGATGEPMAHRASGGMHEHSNLFHMMARAL